MDKDIEIKLILEIENHSCLYDKMSPDYKNKYMKSNAWTDIAAILQEPVAECQRKWKNLRDTFRQYFKLQNMPSGSSAAKKVKWVHFEALMFLVPFIETPSTISNFDNEYSHEPQVIIESATNENTEIFDDISQLPSSNTQNKSKQKRNKRGSEENVDKILRAIQNEKEPSAITAFFISLAKQAEELSRPQQLLLQKKCLQALEDVEIALFDY